MTALIEYLTVLLEYRDLLQTRWQGTTSIWEGLSPASVPLAMPLFETNVFCVSHASAILASDYSSLCLCMAYNSGIILTKVVFFQHIRRKPIQPPLSAPLKNLQELEFHFLKLKPPAVMISFAF